MEVGVRDLKAKLSEFLGRAAAGEQVVVTDRGDPIARIVAYTDGSAMTRGIDEGWIEAPRRTGLAPSQRHRSGRSVLDVLDEDDSELAVQLMTTDPVLVTSRLTEIEVRRNLTRLLDGSELSDARRRFTKDLDAFALVAIDATTCGEASRIAKARRLADWEWPLEGSRGSSRA